MTTTSKIKIKLGPIEVDYEGSETFLKEELPQLLSAVSDSYAKSRFEQGDASGSAIAQNTNAGTGNGGNAGTKLQMTTGAIAAKLAVKSGPELVLAAAAHLKLVKGYDAYSRHDLTKEMKTASAYHKATCAAPKFRSTSI